MIAIERDEHDQIITVFLSPPDMTNGAILAWAAVNNVPVEPLARDVERQLAAKRLTEQHPQHNIPTPISED